MTRRTLRPRLAFPLVIAAFAFALAACGGGSPSTPAAPGGASPAASPAAPTTARACELLTDADIEELTGATVVSKADDVEDTVYVNHCRWTLERPGGGTGTLDLGVVSSGGREIYDHSGGTSGLEPIAGLPADDAGRDTVTGSIFAVRGDTLVDVFALSLGLGRDEPVEVARRVLERLFGGGGSGATAPPGSGGAVVSDPCNLLTDEEILDVTGHPAVSHSDSPRVGMWDAACVWEVDGAGVVPGSITITIKSPGGRAIWDQYMIPIQGEFSAIEGLGDAAFEKAGWPTHVLAGDTYFSVQYTDFPDPGESINTELARRAVENLGG